MQSCILHLDLQVQDLLFYYPITAPANTNVMIISVLLIIAGGLMIGVGICQIVTKNIIYKCLTEYDDDDDIISCGICVR